MKYLWTTIHVKNMEDSILFYSELLNLKLMQRFPTGPETEIAFLGNGLDNETLIELYSSQPESTICMSESLSLGFAVNSMDEMLAAVKSKNLPLHSEPMETPKYKWFTVKDPNGLNVQFFEQKN